MSGPSSAPRGEQPGRPGAGWETELRRLGEVVVPERDGDDSAFGWAEPAPEDHPNRATRRAGARRARRSAQATPEPPFGPQAGSSGLDHHDPETPMTDTITRTPYCHKIRYGVSGTPALTADEMEGSLRPGTGLDPTLIELIYSPARDGKPATVSASVTGWWMSDGEVSQPQQSVATHFRNGPDGWPRWLAKEVRMHRPTAIGRVGVALAFAEDVAASSGPGPARAVQAVIDQLRAARNATPLPGEGEAQR